MQHRRIPLNATCQSALDTKVDEIEPCPWGCQSISEILNFGCLLKSQGSLKKHWCIVGWECKMVQPHWKTIWWALKKLKIELLYDPAILFLHIYPKELKAGSLMFIAALFTVIKQWKQLIIHQQWMDKQNGCKNIRGCYLVSKRKGILIYGITNQISQS